MDMRIAPKGLQNGESAWSWFNRQPYNTGYTRPGEFPHINPDGGFDYLGFCDYLKRAGLGPNDPVRAFSIN